MNKVQISSKYDIKNERKRLITPLGVLNAVVAFLLGRVVFFGAVSPFGLAFLSAYIAKGKASAPKYVAIAVLSIAGTALSGAGISIIKYMLSFVMYGLIYIAVTTLTDSTKGLTEANMAGIAIFLSGVIFSAQTGFELYDILMLLLESALCIVCVHIMQNSIPVLSNSEKTGVLLTSEIISLVIISLLCILGVSDIMLGQFSLGNTFAAVLIMFSALSAGLSGGAVGGCIIGAIYGISKYPMTEIVGVFCLCGAASGLLRKFNKAGIILAFFISNSVISLYCGGAGAGTFSVLELFAAIILFCCIPASATTETERLLSKAANSRACHSVKFITQKLREVGNAFASLAKTFSELIKPEQNDNFADITTLFDKAADKVCKRCGLKFVCWEKQFNTTYDSMMKLAPVLKESGKAKTSDLGQPFRSRCIKSEEFIAELNRVYGQHKLDMQWHQKVIESKELAMEQFAGMTKIIDNIITEIDTATELDLRLEKVLNVELEHCGFKKCDTSVIKNKFGRYEVSIRLKRCVQGQECMDKILPAVSSVIGREMDERSVICADKGNLQKCEIFLAEKERFSVCCAVASRIKQGQTQSGDNYNYIPVCDGKYVLVLSDGMGSGGKAASRSGTTVTMLRQLFGAGFDKQSAVKIINSALLLNTNDESFATIDIAILDLFRSEAEFIKIGANSSYIKRGKKVSEINSSTLPAGILNDVDVETSYKRLNDGDYIIMISDGVQDIQQQWLKSYIAKLDSLSPQPFADRILEEAIRQNGGCINDDMTVMVARLMET